MHFDELVYETRWFTMHDDINLLSRQFPNEIFIVRYCDVEVQILHPAECYRYKDGKATFMGYEPVYKFSDHDHLYNIMGKETLLKLWFRVREYLYRLDHTKESLIEGEYDYVDMNVKSKVAPLSSNNGVGLKGKREGVSWMVNDMMLSRLSHRSKCFTSQNEAW